MRKYVKPGSLTWWASAAPLAAGIILATEPLHGWFEIAQTLRNFSGEVPPAMLINAGLLGIGLRGAIT
jgi:hypothetical protein